MKNIPKVLVYGIVPVKFNPKIQFKNKEGTQAECLLFVFNEFGLCKYLLMWEVYSHVLSLSYYYWCFYSYSFYYGTVSYSY